MAAFKCFICGKYAGDKMKCGTWICKDHIKLLGGMRNLREIRFMTTTWCSRVSRRARRTNCGGMA